MKNQVLKTLYDIKHGSPDATVGAHNNRTFQLVPLTQKSVDDKKVIALLANWRDQVQEWFPAQFTVSEEGTKTWLQKGVIENPDRLLFMIEVDDEYIGHVGLYRFDFDNKTVDIDNIVRGVNKYPGIMFSAIKTMMQWAREVLDVQGFTLITHSDNTPAVSLYNKLGFVEEKRIPLKKERFENRTEWVEQEDDTQAEKYNVYMKLQQNRS